MSIQKILIVGDDVNIINGLGRTLEHEGYQVFIANSKVEGIKLAREVSPDLGILDVMMTTHYEGFELAEELINDPALSNLSILMQSSIDVFTTTKESVREMAREFRQDSKCKELQVILLKDIVTGKAGIDYRNDEGRTVWLPVDGFMKKPVDSRMLLPQIKSLLAEKEEVYSN